VDEVELIMVGANGQPKSTNRPVELPPDTLKRSAKFYTRLLGQLQESFNPWLSPKKKIVTRRATIYAKSLQDPTKPEEAKTTRRLLRH